MLNVTQEAASGVVYEPQVYELVKGSSGLSGTFTIDLHDVNGPRKVAFNEPADRMKRKLEEMFTVGSVFVERYEYPSQYSGGWGDMLIDDDSVGGYEWRIFFVRNTGAYNGYSFPPGSGNIDPITITYSPGIMVHGTNVKVQTHNMVEGSTPIDGSFTLSFNGDTTESIRYDQQPLEAKYLLEAMDSIGEVSVDGKFRFMQEIPNVYVSVDHDSHTLSVEYDGSDADYPTDIRQYLAPGDLFRVGGVSVDEDSHGQTSIDGAELYGIVDVQPGSPILALNDISLSELKYPGELVRIGADNYTVVRSGVEVQVLSIDCGDEYLVGDCGRVHLEFTYNGVDRSTECIKGSNGAMTTAAQLRSYFNKIEGIGSVEVTRTTSLDGKSYAFSIYFQGDSLYGDITNMEAEEGCTLAGTTTNSMYQLDQSVSLGTIVQGGFTEVQAIRLNTEAGYIEGDYFKISYENSITGASGTTDCIDFGASADDVADALNALKELTDFMLPFTVDVISATELEAESSCFGIVEVGDKLRIGTDVVTISRIGDYNVESRMIGLEGPGTTQTGPGITVYKIYEESVAVARYGTGNSTATVLTITQTATEEVPDDSRGYYKLKLALDGVEARTSCVKYHASASDMQAAINTLASTLNFVDDHITVTRSGDGTVASGYGYVYTVRFGGPILALGQSAVLGYSNPSIEIIDEGNFGGCQDINATYIDSLKFDYDSSDGEYTWTTAVVNSVQQSALEYVQVGNHIRFPAFNDPYRTYLVTAVTEYTVTVIVR